MTPARGFGALLVVALAAQVAVWWGRARGDGDRAAHCGGGRGVGEMKAELEAKLWDAVKRGEKARNVIRAMVEAGDISAHKQAHATLEKWCVQGCYDYGVTLDLGWADHGGKEPVRR